MHKGESVNWLASLHKYALGMYTMSPVPPGDARWRKLVQLHESECADILGHCFCCTDSDCSLGPAGRYPKVRGQHHWFLCMLSLHMFQGSEVTIHLCMLTAVLVLRFLASIYATPR